MIGQVIRFYQRNLTPRLKKILIGIVVFFVLFTLVGFFVVPPILKSVLVNKLSESLNREVTITQIKMNPYALSLTVRGFQVKERKGQETFLSFDELFVNLQSFSAPRMALILKEIRLTKPYIKILRNEDETYNFSDLLEKREPQPSAKPPEKPKPLRFSLNNIRIENGSVDFWDGPKQTKHTIRELHVGVPFLSNIPSQIDIFVQPVFSAKINETPYRLEGSTKPFRDTLETVFDININDLNLPYYLAYLPIKLNFKIVSAFLDVQTKISFIQSRDKKPSLTVTGAVSLKKVALDDRKQTPLFRLPLLEVSIAPTEPLRMIFHLSKVSIRSPELEVRRSPEGAFNIEAFLPEKKEVKPAPAAEKKTDETAETALSLEIDEVQLTGGKVSFSDGSTKKPFKTVLNPIELKAAHFSNGKDKKTAYSLSIASEAKEKIRLEGELSLEPLWTEGRFEIKSIPLMKYSPYYQDRILFNVEEGRLDFATRYRYAKGEKEPEITVSGMAILLNGLRLRKQEEKEDFLTIPTLSVRDASADVTQKKLTIGMFSTEKGSLSFHRLKNGEIDLTKLLAPSPPGAAPAAQEKEKTEEKPWVVALNNISMDQYAVTLGDQTVSRPTSLTIEKIALRGEQISTAKNAQGKLSLTFLLDQTSAFSTQNRVSLDPLGIEGSLEIKRVILNKYAPYYQDSLLFDILEGELDFSTSYQYKKTEREAVTKVMNLSTSLRHLRLKKRGEPETFLDIPTLMVKNTGIDLNQKEISIGEFSTQKGMLFVRRDKDGKLNLQSLLSEPAAQEGRREPQPIQEKAKPAEKPWLIKVGQIAVDDYTIKAEDQAPAEPVNLLIDQLRLRADRLSTAEGQKGGGSLGLRLNQKGTISTEGTVGLNPVSASMKLNLKEIEVKPLQPYFTENVKISVTDGAVSTEGNFALIFSDKDGLRTTYQGKASLTRFASIDKKNAEDFLKLESFSLENLRFDSAPFSLDIGGIALSNFFARVVVQPDGILNLQQVFGQEEAKKEASSKKEGPPAPPAEKKAAEPPKNIKIGTVTLQGGKVNFLDRSVQPEYSANLAEIGGRISGLSSEETTQADLELRTKLNDFAPLEITGKINPLKKDLYVDLKARFKDMELSPLTPYSGRFVGYTVEKGKLSFDLSYLIDKRKLDAKNQIFIDQFNLGEKVESPQATKLPVKLAIALLKDRKGEIKLDIPVSGSLDDPKFSIWGIILKILVNLIAKAATSPFALLGAIAGGGEEISFVEFDYGNVLVTEPSAKKLSVIAKALFDRPSLKMDIEGHVDMEKDREGLKQVLFQRKLKAQKLREMVKKGETVPSVDEVKIEKQEYEKYLKMAYKEEKFPKPRNILGIAKDIPGPEMETLILTHIEVKEGDLRTLASQRAMKVKEAIVKSGPVEPERIFILEPKSLAPEKKEKVKDSRVDFKLK